MQIHDVDGFCLGIYILIVCVAAALIVGIFTSHADKQLFLSNGYCQVQKVASTDYVWQKCQAPVGK